MKSSILHKMIRYAFWESDTGSKTWMKLGSKLYKYLEEAYSEKGQQEWRPKDRGVFEVLKDQEGGQWSGRERASGGGEVRQNVEAGSGEQFCIEPCHALVGTWVLLREMRMHQKVSSGGVIWSNLCDDS